MPRTPSDVFLAVVEGVGDRRYDALPELYAEQTDVRHPMAPGGAPVLRTRDDVRRHFCAAAEHLPNVEFHPTDITIHETTDPEVIVAEFSYKGTVLDTGEPFAVPGVFVMRVRDGEIVESRDYFDHLAFGRALRELPEMLDRLERKGADGQAR
jgi:uncharacterized protein